MSSADTIPRKSNNLLTFLAKPRRVSFASLESDDDWTLDSEVLSDKPLVSKLIPPVVSKLMFSSEDTITSKSNDLLTFLAKSRRVSLASQDSDDDWALDSEVLISEDEPLVSKLISYAGWYGYTLTVRRISPTAIHLTTDLSCRQIELILRNDLQLNVPPDDIAMLKELKNGVPREIKIYPLVLKGNKEYFPDLLVLVASLFSSVMTRSMEDKTFDEKGLIASLSEYDIVIGGSELTSLLSLRLSLKKSPPGWKLYASRPLPLGPLFIDSIKENGESSTSGGIHAQFRHAIINPGKFERLNSIRRLKIGDLTVLVAGDIDALDPDTHVPCHVFARPDWGRRDNARMLSIWHQSKISGVEKVVTGIYKTRETLVEPGATIASPLMTFPRRDIRRETLKGFGQDLKYRAESILYLKETISFLIANCTGPSCGSDRIWKIKGRVGKETTVVLETERAFTVTRDLLYRIAEATLSIDAKSRSLSRTLSRTLSRGSSRSCD